MQMPEGTIQYFLWAMIYTIVRVAANNRRFSALFIFAISFTSACV